VLELAELLGIRDLLERRPRDLSGGERQRVGLGRALSFRPSILLLDEPLSALDDDTRAQIVALLQQIREHTGVTTLHVTHNRAEADQLGTMGLRIENGRVSDQWSGVSGQLSVVRGQWSVGSQGLELTSGFP
jgi:molybdate/tungstate transport system ATP-binding protein